MMSITLVTHLTCVIRRTGMSSIGVGGGSAHGRRPALTGVMVVQRQIQHYAVTVFTAQLTLVQERESLVERHHAVHSVGVTCGICL